MKRQFRVLSGTCAITTLSDKNAMRPFRMYRAYSFGKPGKCDLRYRNVRFNWYRLERDNPAVQYDKVIADYDLIPEKI